MKPFTGRHMAMIIIAFLGVVVIVNLIMARYAVRTFGGTVVDNSYVASQYYNRWLEEARRQNSLGWAAEIMRSETGVVTVTASVPEQDMSEATVLATATHPLGGAPERTLTFARTSNGDFVAQERLPSGRWYLRITIRNGGSEARFWKEVTS